VESTNRITGAKFDHFVALDSYRAEIKSAGGYCGRDCHDYGGGSIADCKDLTKKCRKVETQKKLPISVGGTNDSQHVCFVIGLSWFRPLDLGAPITRYG
jgi:hypothetical protein